MFQKCRSLHRHADHGGGQGPGELNIDVTVFPLSDVTLVAVSENHLVPLDARHRDVLRQGKVEGELLTNTHRVTTMVRHYFISSDLVQGQSQQ